MTEIRGQAMRRWMLLIFLIFAAGLLSAYSKAELERLRNNPAWIVGLGRATNDTMADRAAIQDLLSQISVQVSSSTEYSYIEKNGNLSEYWESALNTYSSTHLDGAERRVFETQNGYEVFRYMRRADYHRLFEDRKRMLKDYVSRGLDAERDLRIGDALMNHYWALVLLRTHPDVTRINHEIDKEMQQLITWLPEHIRIILRGLKFEVKDQIYCQDDRLTSYEIFATYKDQAIRNLDLRYYYGNNWSVPITMKDGYAIMEFFTAPEEVPNPLRLDVIYDYQYKAGINKDLYLIMNEVSLPIFTESRFELRLARQSIATEFQPEIQLKAEEILPDVQPEIALDAIDAQDLVDKATLLSTLIQQKNYSALEELCTASGKEYVKKLLQYGNARLARSNFEISYTQMDDIAIMRGLPLQFYFPRSGRNFNETLSITFDQDGLIERINLGLSEMAITDIMGSVRAEDEEKQRIISFVEDYKTAYSLKDISYVERVFSDNALIIVGSMLQDDPTPLDGLYQRLGQNWQANRYSKAQYIENLRRVFETNEYVNLALEDNILTRTNDPESKIFGIQIRQNYYSQSYADQGYLFLMFDLEDVGNPRIYVRTWQPEMNPDGSIFGLKDFYMGQY